MQCTSKMLSESCLGFYLLGENDLLLFNFLGQFWLFQNLGNSIFFAYLLVVTEWQLLLTHPAPHLLILRQGNPMEGVLVCPSQPQFRQWGAQCALGKGWITCQSLEGTCRRGHFTAALEWSSRLLFAARYWQQNTGYQSGEQIAF